MKLRKNQKLVFAGDSITDCGRARPVGEGLGAALGNGYVSMVDALLGACHGDLKIRVVNQGSGGDQARGLKARWETDILALKPDWVAILIGINDVWRQFDLPKDPACHVYIDEYEACLEAMISQTLPQVQGLVLMTPYYMEPNRQDAMRAAMDRYGAVVRKLAHAHKTIFVDTQAAIDDLLVNYYPATIGWDRVHPNATGHMVLARAFLKAMDFAW
jgi:lysophospholipase L1-like esterase